MLICHLISSREVRCGIYTRRTKGNPCSAKPQGHFYWALPNMRCPTDTVDCDGWLCISDPPNGYGKYSAWWTRNAMRSCCMQQLREYAIRELDCARTPAFDREKEGPIGHARRLRTNRCGAGASCNPSTNSTNARNHFYAAQDHSHV